MCLITYIPSTSKPDWKILDRAARSNPDGFGVAWHSKGRARSLRSMDWSKVRAKAKALAAAGKALAVHHRWTTHGASNVANCHPFSLPDHGAQLMHNGVFTRTPVPMSPGRSDTHAVAVWANTFAVGFLQKGKAVARLHQLAGGYNKMLFMDSNGEVHIINEEAGTWRDGCWYSNGNSFPGGSGVGRPTTAATPRKAKRAKRGAGGSGLTFADAYALRRATKPLRQLSIHDIAKLTESAPKKKRRRSHAKRPADFLVDVRLASGTSENDREQLRELARYYAGAECGARRNRLGNLRMYGFGTRDDAAAFVEDLYAYHGEQVESATYTGNAPIRN